MERDDKFDELLDRWEELREAGTPVSPEELCRDCPELLDDVRRQVEAMLWVPLPAGPDGNLLSFSSHDAAGRKVPQPPVPTTLGRYRLESPIGAGGFGQVWRAYDPELQRCVAIKIPRPDRAVSPQSVDRFREEARRVAGLKCPGIVPVYDVGQQGPLVFIVSELVEGQSLAERIAQARPAWPEAVRIVASAADCLHSAHQHGLIHRDVKPANILLDRDANVFLTDFGIAATATQIRTEGLGTSGTLAFMSPEQVCGDNAVLDVRTDVYSLGVVLYELLTGRLPFDAADPVEAKAKILSALPVPPRRLNPKIPSAVERVCLKALSKAADQRWASATEMALALREAAQSPRTRRRRMITSAVLFLAALVGVTTYSMWSASHPTRPESSRPTAATVITPHPIAPIVIAPGTPESQALGDELGKRAESMFMPNLEKVHQGLTQHKAELQKRIADVRKTTPPATSGRKPNPPSKQAQLALLQKLGPLYRMNEPRSHEEEIQLARKLLADGRIAPAGSDEQFLLVRKAMEFAVRGGDAELAMEAIDAMCETFYGDALATKPGVLEEFATRGSDATHLKSLTSAARKVLEEARAAKRADVVAAIERVIQQAGHRADGANRGRTDSQ